MFNAELRTPMQTQPHEPRESARNPAPSAVDQRVRIDSQRLLQGGRELFISHAGEEYRLRLTRNDKLILTK